jgi:SAM-dependent methyltransferase
MDPIPLHYLPGIGKGEFIKIGREFVRLFVEVGGLQSHERVLDVGCGLARMALPLRSYLDRRGSYAGFDVVEDIINWNRHNITSRDRRFQFHFVDVYNSSYNPEGTVQPGELSFPYADDDFDFVFATSVFTHLMDDSVTRYLAEIARVLRPGGRAFTTFFLLDDPVRELLEKEAGDIPFRHRWKHGLLLNSEKPEDAVAFEANWVFEELEAHGLKPRRPPAYGFWSGRPGGVSYQDIVISDL